MKDMTKQEFIDFINNTFPDDKVFISATFDGAPSHDEHRYQTLRSNPVVTTHKRQERRCSIILDVVSFGEIYKSSDR